MDFTTHTLVDGQYVTRTVDLDTVLRRHEKGKPFDSSFSEVEPTPVLGLLTHTVVHSPLVHWILPATLRDLSKNDVAFVGENFIQVKELRADGFLWDVIRKDDFGARIRTARVIGSMKAYTEEQFSELGNSKVKHEDDDYSMQSVDDLPAQSSFLPMLPFPPQSILLQLETGDSVFLIISKALNGKIKFISHQHRISKPMLGLQPGMHLAIDPSSRYMAVGCSEAVFAIYALESRDALKRQYSTNQVPHFVNAERYVYFHGAILKMEFLYPSPEDESHIILLVLFTHKGKTRMKIYEWVAGVKLIDIPAQGQRGHLLEETRRMPLLLIPLTIKSSFILVSESSMAVCRDILTGSPRFIDFNDRVDPPTALYHGLGNPLWTAWARPVRLPEHAAHRDDIYITREDGLIKFLEIDSEEDEFIRADMNIGDFDCNCGAALACLDYHAYDDMTGDFLITGGDSCAGGTYLVRARHAPVFTQSIQNWTPAQDFVIVPAGSALRRVSVSIPTRHSTELIQQPDRVFACVGKGTRGALTEFRYGLEASIALEFQNQTPFMEAWVLPPISLPLGHEESSLILTTVGDHSILLEVSGDASACAFVEQGHVSFDLNSRTITAATYGGWNVQVTEANLVFVAESWSLIHSTQDLLSDNHIDPYHGTESSAMPAIAYAAVVHQCLVFSIRAQDVAYLFALPLVSVAVADKNENPRTAMSASRFLGKIAAQSTCVTMCLADNVLFAVVAEDSSDSVFLKFKSYEPTWEDYVVEISKHFFISNKFVLEQIVSIAISYRTSSMPIFLCGTRNGLLLSLEVCPKTRSFRNSHCERLGVTPIFVHHYDDSGNREAFLVNCDSRVYFLKLPKWPDHELPKDLNRRMNTLNRVWITDAGDPNFQQPSIHAIARLLPTMSSTSEGGLLMVSGSSLLLVAFGTEPKIVPRHISISGTPSRLMYSARLEALVVTASVNGKSTILFIDPNTGADLSFPRDKTGQSVNFASGFGNFNERAFSLLEWSYNKDGNTWQYIVVSTNTGNVLLLSTDLKRRANIDNDDSSQTGHTSSGLTVHKDMIHYYTRHIFRCVEPVYAVVGFEEGLFYCSGETLYCQVLDVAEKKFRHVAQHVLPSPAFSLTFQGGRLYVVTSCHSLEIFHIIPSTDRASTNIVRTHGDQVSRFALHHITAISAPSGLALQLVSDKNCSIVGLWATEGTKADTLETIFEAQLSSSLIRFRTGCLRPIWDRARTLDGVAIQADRHDNEDQTMVNSGRREGADVQAQPDILGLSIDGSITHCKVLDRSTWRFLRFLINRAMQSPKVCEYTCEIKPYDLEPSGEPKSMMHIDGNLLRRVLDTRSLGELVSIKYENDIDATIFKKFRDLLIDMHGESGVLTTDSNSDACVDQAYDDLEWFLRPVM